MMWGNLETKYCGEVISDEVQLWNRNRWLEWNLTWQGKKHDRNKPKNLKTRQNIIKTWQVNITLDKQQHMDIYFRQIIRTIDCTDSICITSVQMIMLFKIVSFLKHIPCLYILNCGYTLLLHKKMQLSMWIIKHQKCSLTYAYPCLSWNHLKVRWRWHLPLSSADNISVQLDSCWTLQEQMYFCKKLPH